MFAARRLGCRLLLAALGAALVTPVAASMATPAGATGTQVSGVARLVHGDNYYGRLHQIHTKVDEHWEIDTGRSAVRVELPEGTELEAGRAVTVSGSFKNNVFAAKTDGVVNRGWDISALQTLDGEKRIAVIMLTFANDSHRPYTRAQVQDMVFDADDSTAAFYRASSNGQIQITGDVFDWRAIPDNNAHAGCQVVDWALHGLDAAGIDEDDYDNIVFALNDAPSCNWWGLGTLPGKWSWVNGTPMTQVVSHELGHNYGVHHANALRCTKGSTPVMVSSKCDSYEYGDPFSVMGYSTRLHNNWQRTQMDYMDSTRTVTESGEYKLAPSEWASTPYPRMIRVRRPDGKYYNLEFRRRDNNFDNFASNSPAVKGVSIRIAPDTGMVQSQLLDCTPSTASFEDAPCVVGKRMVDTSAAIIISTEAVSTGAATVHITFNADVQAPTAPESVRGKASTRSVSLSWKSSRDNRKVKGYRVFRNNAAIAVVTGTSFKDVKVKRATAYTYTVAAYDTTSNTGPKSRATKVKAG